MNKKKSALELEFRILKGMYVTYKHKQSFFSDAKRILTKQNERSKRMMQLICELSKISNTK